LRSSSERRDADSIDLELGKEGRLGLRGDGKDSVWGRVLSRLNSRGLMPEVTGELRKKEDFHVSPKNDYEGGGRERSTWRGSQRGNFNKREATVTS